MEEFSLMTLLAVFEEMFGRGLFWAMVAGAVGFAILVYVVQSLMRGKEADI